MGEGFEHLRCPMCGGELIYSDGTHDLCCVKNPYESMGAGAEEAGGAMHEERAEYRGGKDAHIYKVWKEGEEGNSGFARWAATEHDHKSADAAGMMHDAGFKIQDETEGNEGQVSAGEEDEAVHSDTPVKGHTSSETSVRRSAPEGYAAETLEARAPVAPVKGHAEGSAVYDNEPEASSAEVDKANLSATSVKGHACVFAVSFTESARFGTLWSVRVVHGETNYFALMRLMQKIEKRRSSGEPLAANAPHQPKRRERSAAAKLAFRFGIEEEDVYSIKFSSETVKRLAIFYGIPERDVKRIREEELEENNADNRFDE